MAMNRARGQLFSNRRFPDDLLSNIFMAFNIPSQHSTHENRDRPNFWNILQFTSTIGDAVFSRVHSHLGIDGTRCIVLIENS